MLRYFYLLLLIPFGAAYADCPSSAGASDYYSQGWGTSLDGQRFQKRTRINASNVDELELRWVYGFASDTPRSYPLVSEDTIFVGDTGRGLVALDRESGCVRWENTDIEDVATAVVGGQIGDKAALFFTGRTSGVYAVDAETGELLWSSVIEEEAVPMYSGSVLVHNKRVYVPISSMEIGLTMNPLYGCCTTSGGMAALDAESGEMLWYLPTVEEEPQVTGRRWLFIEEQGPSGAPVWAAPTLDVERGLLLFGTGQNYSRPATKTSDAIFAVDIETGKPRWVRQFTEGDAYNISCEVSADHPNCPEPMGPDVDFGAPPVVVGDLVLAAQKSGDVYAVRADDGSPVWSRRFGKGGPLGGVHWGIAVDESTQTLFVPMSDRGARYYEDQEASPGLFAINYEEGSVKWSTARQAICEGCDPGLSAAISVGPGFVVAGGLDGALEAYAADDGRLLWQFDSGRSFDAVNGVETHGGGFDAHGPMIADDQVIAVSGYGSFGQTGGNALLVFGLPEKSGE